jgi:hypothetical protein
MVYDLQLINSKILIGWLVVHPQPIKLMHQIALFHKVKTGEQTQAAQTLVVLANRGVNYLVTVVLDHKLLVCVDYIL